jgi:hypothetical protein
MFILQIVIFDYSRAHPQVRPEFTTGHTRASPADAEPKPSSLEKVAVSNKKIWTIFNKSAPQTDVKFAGRINPFGLLPGPEDSFQLPY